MATIRPLPGHDETERTRYSAKDAAKRLRMSPDAVYKAAVHGVGRLGRLLVDGVHIERSNDGKRVWLRLSDEEIAAWATPAAAAPEPNSAEPPSAPPTHSTDPQLIAALEARITDRDAIITDLRERLAKAEAQAETERRKAEEATSVERERADRIAAQAAEERARLLALIEEAQRRAEPPPAGFLARLFSRR